MEITRSKLDLELNTPRTMALLFDKPLTGENRYGPYYLYALADPDTGEEFSFFAPPDVHDVLKNQKTGDVVSITKTAKQQGRKVVTAHSVEVLTPMEKEKETAFDVVFPPSNGNGNGHATLPSNGNGTAPATGDDSYFNAMLSSCRDAQRIQNEIHGIDINRIAITLFIGRAKTNGNGNGYNAAA